MDQRPDPDKTREIRTPPRREQAPQTPWWQNVNRHVPPLPPPRPQPAPRPVPVPQPAPPPPPPTGRSRRRRAILLRAGIAVIAVEAATLGVVLFLLRGPDYTVLDVTKAERGVEQVLVDPVDGYGVKSVTTVVCNDGANPVVRKGATFTCEVVVDGSRRRVAAVFQDDEGTYAVDRPR